MYDARNVTWCYNLPRSFILPDRESYCKSEEMVESMREEKRRKGTEAVAEDLFYNEKVVKQRKLRTILPSALFIS